MLDDINYSNLYPKAEIINHKLKLADRAPIFANDDFDVGEITTFNTLYMQIKDENKSELVKPYDLTPTDQIKRRFTCWNIRKNHQIV